MGLTLKLCCILVCLAVVKPSADASSYQGRFTGYCMRDGIYYSNEGSFVLCSGGYPSHQQCAPGTKNAPFSEIDARRAYFCGDRLSDTPSYQSHGYPQPAPRMQSYQPPMPSHPAPMPSYNQPKMPSYTPQMPSHSAPQPHYSSQSKSQPSSYRGRYPGNCPSDGMYYKDDSTFVMCSGGNAYVTPCPPGTLNHPSFQFTGLEFCGINLVDKQIVMSYPVSRY